MKTKIIIAFFFIYLAITITGYFKLTNENKNLLNKNNLLLFKLDSLLSKNESLIYKPIVVEKSKKIKLGEEYIAEVNLSLIQKKNIPNVITGDVIENSILEESIDTLIFNEEYNTFVYRNTPKKSGLYHWGGIITYYDFENQEKKLYFTKVFEVKK